MALHLLSNNPAFVVLLAVFLIGALFYWLGTILVRRERKARIADAPAAVEEAAPAPAATPVETVEALLARGDAASIRELEALRDRDPSDEIRDAADAALMVIGSR